MSGCENNDEHGTRDYCPHCSTCHVCLEEADYPVLTSSGWISVEDRLPIEDDDVLVYVDYKNRSPVIHQSYYYPASERWSGLNDVDHLITHWMPLPEPPND